MSGYTTKSPDTILSTIISDGVPAGSKRLSTERDIYASSLALQPNLQTTNNYTLILSDFGKCIVINSTTAANVNISNNATVAFQVGTVIPWYGLGAGLITFVAGSSVTLETRANATFVSAIQGASGSLWQRSVNTWVLSGDIT